MHPLFIGRSLPLFLCVKTNMQKFASFRAATRGKRRLSKNHAYSPPSVIHRTVFFHRFFFSSSSSLKKLATLCCQPNNKRFFSCLVRSVFYLGRCVLLYDTFFWSQRGFLWPGSQWERIAVIKISPHNVYYTLDEQNKTCTHQRFCHLTKISFTLFRCVCTRGIHLSTFSSLCYSSEALLEGRNTITDTVAKSSLKQEDA